MKNCSVNDCQKKLLVVDLEKLLLTTKLLQQNAVGCAEMHHGLDTQLNRLPGWLMDTQKDIDTAQAIIDKERA